MKKLIVLGLFVIFLNAKSQVIDTIDTKCESPEMSTLLGYQDLVRVVTNYHNNTYGSSEDHTKALYINDTSILFLENFFLNGANSKFYGICFYFIDYNSKPSAHQRRDHQSFLYLTPIYDDPTSGRDSISDFKAFNQYYKTVSTNPMFIKKNKLNNSIPCYGTCDSSMNDWIWSQPPTIPYKRLHANHINGAATTDVFLLSPNRNYHLARRANYESGQGRECFNSQTKRVYFHKNVILRLAQFIRDGNNVKNFPMIGIYFGSYNYLLLPSQSHPNQTTVNLVTMRKMDNGYLEPDVCSYIAFYEKQRQLDNAIFKTSKDKKSVRLAENHGTLCPTQCPTNGN